ncbi:hypothetical protein LTR37_004854 [Vermiconidia calcicola]|uniref:Uncharacterized protein n=1 Tax=Vermiconidia calcicola TaxID=1690605 RepID=A0ACC3NM76_9PEZI|nr:hypothetical protein LTR37_004854 [Vermiconidia calcicola]
MLVEVLSQGEAIAAVENLEPVDPPITKSFFRTFGTNGCLLNCGLLESHYQHNKADDGSSSQAGKKLAKSMRKQRDQLFYKSIQKWFTATQMTASAAQGCGSCDILYQIFCRSYQQNENVLFDEYEYSVSDTFGLERRRHAVPESAQLVQLFQPRGLGVTLERFPRSNLLCGRDVSMRRLRQWIGDCLDSHNICAKYGAKQDESSRPARLIDLKAITHGRRTGVRLVDTDTGGPSRYACLSHRWDGEVLRCQTTTQNLGQRSEFLALEDLPRTFRDAVDIARDLGVEYLWVDSLCIIQSGDDGEDLDKELGKMSAIYQSAYLTIAAVSSPTSSEGCFVCEQWPDLCFSVADVSHNTHLIGARILDKSGIPASTAEVADRYPLLTRAWVLQERLLSPRLLQCNYGEFTFDCLECSQCECRSSLAPHPEYNIRGRSIGLKDSAFRRRRLPVDGRGRRGAELAWKQETFEYWRFSVTMYMRLGLSYPSDVLPAIAGCAQSLGALIDTSYVAGMWRETLSVDLMWYVTHDRHHAPHARPKGSTAPSWSWASAAMGQQISYVDPKRNIGEDSRIWVTTKTFLSGAIKEVRWEPESPNNPFGRVKHAHLEIHAVVLPWHLRLFCDKVKRGSGLTRSRDLHVQTSPHLSECRTTREGLAIDQTTVQIYMDTSNESEALDVEPFDYCRSEPWRWRRCALAQIYLLQALHRAGRGRSYDVFLMLKEVSSNGDSIRCFQRVGLVMLTTQSDTVVDWAELTLGTSHARKEEFLLC